MAGTLDGLKIVVPESRELDLFVGMLESEGACAVRCPLVDILDVEDAVELDAWLRRFVEGEFDDLVLLTGEGLRRLTARSETLGTKAAFLSALTRVRRITRGPKPVRALRELGVSSDLAATTPTSQGVIAALAREELSGRKIGVQLYPGPGGDWLVAELRGRKAVVSPVTPYRYASRSEAGEVADAIRGLASGDFGMIAFTSKPQIERLLEVAQELGLEHELALALKRAKIAAVGPVAEDSLKALGVTNVIRPANAFHLKPLVRAIVEAWKSS
jgi:uroporphyrinogen-III synthase